MIQLPESLDFQAVNILLEAFRGKNNDVEEIAVASWNIAGYGIHLGLPVFKQPVQNPLIQGKVSTNKEVIDEIEEFLTNPSDPELKKGVLSSAAIMFLIKLAVKYLLA
jgi:hypothetical protein